MKVTTHMKTTSLLITAAVALFVSVPYSQAAPARAKAKTVRAYKIHYNEKTIPEERPSAVPQLADDTSLFRSRAEMDMLNPG